MLIQFTQSARVYMGKYTRDNETNAQSLDLYSVSECVDRRRSILLRHTPFQLKL